MADERIDINPVIEDGGTAAVQEEVRTRRVRRTYIDPEIATHIGEVPPEPCPFSPEAPGRLGAASSSRSSRSSTESSAYFMLT